MATEYRPWGHLTVVEPEPELSTDPLAVWRGILAATLLLAVMFSLPALLWWGVLRGGWR
jgi:hypothetical protein